MGFRRRIYFFLLGSFFLFHMHGLSQVNADFTVSGTEGCGSLQVNFFDQSISFGASIVDWSWDLGTVSSVKQNPGAIFDTPGAYTICLTVTDSKGNTDQKCEDQLINIYALPEVDFTLSHTSGCSPLQIQFNNTSTSQNGAISNLIWDLGGSANVINSMDTNEEVSSVYTEGGLYSVSLIAEDERGCMNTKTITDAIEIYQLDPVLISTDIISFCSLPWEIAINNDNPDPNTTYVWDFGNGQTYTGEQPPNVFYNEGSFDLRIIQDKGGCRDTTIFPEFINTQEISKVDYSPIAVCTGVPITFRDTSFIRADSLKWSFEDGTQYTTDVLQHIFIDGGCQSVQLIRYIRDCIDTLTIACIDVKTNSAFDFELDNQFACQLPAKVGLSASSTSQGSFLWNVEGVGDLIGPNHSIDINAFGVFDASVSFTNNEGCVNLKENISIPVVEFEGNLPLFGPRGCTPLNFQLKDSVQSTLPIVSYQWSIGDPIIFTSNEQSPSFEISEIGRYDVTLIVENENGCLDTIVREEYIQVGERPTVDFFASPLDECLIAERSFTSTVSSNVDFWEWDFGDGGMSNLANPIYTYSDLGIFDVRLTVYHNGCASSISKSEYINVAEPISKFAIDYTCETPYTVAINNASLGADSLYWTITIDSNQIDTLLDSLILPYTFPGVGNYLVSHYAMNFETGCEHIREDTIRIREPRAQYIADTLLGCAPFTVQIKDFSQNGNRYKYVIPGGSSPNDTLVDQEITYTNAGVYPAPSLIITDIHACQDTFTLEDSIYVNEIIPNLIFPAVSCVPNEEVFIDSSYSLFGSIAERFWNLDDSSQVSSDSIARFLIDEGRIYSFTYSAFDTWGCEIQTTQNQLIEGVIVDPDFAVDTLGCTTTDLLFRAGINDPNVSSYLWQFGDGTSSDMKNARHRYTQEGIYSICLTVEDNRGCSKTICKDSLVRIVDPKADFIGDPTFDTCPPLLSEFTNTSSNANNFIWDFGDQSGQSRIDTPSHVYTAPGNFSVTLIAELTPSCKDTFTREDYIQVLGPSGGFEIDVDTSCVPLSIQLQAFSDDEYTYIWDFGNGEIDSVGLPVNVDTADYTYTMTGKFVPKLIIIDDGGCTRTFSSQPVRVDEVSLEFIVEEDTVCNPPIEVAFINQSLSSADANYHWLIKGPQTLRSTETAPNINFVEGGLYDVSLFVEAGYCYDTLAKASFLEVGDQANIQFDIIESLFCEKIETRFVNNSTIDYGTFTNWLWDFGDGNTSLEYAPMHRFQNPGMYTISLTGFTNYGCSNTLSKTIEVLPSAQVVLIDDLLICIGDQAQLEATITPEGSASAINWIGDASMSCTACLDPIVMPVQNTTYYFSASHESGCVDRDSIEVTVIPTPGPSLEIDKDTLICLGTEATIRVLDFNSDYQYNWAIDPGLDCYSDCPEIHASPEENTQYFVTVTNSYGCVRDDSILIEVERSIPDFLIENKTICEGAQTQLSITGGNQPFWENKADISCLDCPTTTVQPSYPQYYTVTVSSDLGCIYKDSVFVDIVPTGSISIQADSLICKGEEIVVNGSGIGQASWSPNGLFMGQNDFNPSIQLFDTETLVLTLTEDECIQKDSLKVEVIAKANISAIGDTICPFEMAILEAFGQPADAYRWINDVGQSYDGAYQAIELEESKTFQAIGSFRSCEEDTVEVHVIVYPKIEIELERFYTIFSNKAAVVSLEASKPYKYNWYPSVGLSCDDCPEPTIDNVFEENVYDLLVTDPSTGCTLEENITVRYTNQCAQDVWGLPNIFSPNRDGYNDGFRVFTSDKEAFISLSIYDRWGEQLFLTEDLQEKWRGDHNGVAVVSGVYPFRLEAICQETQEIYVIFGDVTLVR